MCVCFQRRRVRHNENYDRRAFARKERNLHCDVHVTAENKHTLPPFWSLDSLYSLKTRSGMRARETLMVTHSRQPKTAVRPAEKQHVEM